MLDPYSATNKDDLLDSYSDPTVQLQPCDKLTVELLELLDRYHQTYKAMTENMREAYSDIERGNFVGLSFSHFGSDMWDYRPSAASLTIKLQNNAPTLEKRGITKTKKKADNTKLESTDLKSENEEKTSDQVGKATDFEQTSTNTHNRYNKNTCFTELTISEDDPLPVREPLKMFNGGIVPTAIRRAQKEMRTAMNYVPQVSILKTQIEKLLDELEKNKNTKE
ncbi:hypothetical protein HII12_003374 [Brettanomyces bruxellensis]|uniref:Vacuolar ATPase assembly protein VMA22 n=1 Tax=Dekkera bruxellensis TaxID=5007 RepID=A0A8H6BDG6_DEKBR|nr:hypothetical protein HII12_003374 [Brettanomyces bruxellensis]